MTRKDPRQATDGITLQWPGKRELKALPRPRDPDLRLAEQWSAADGGVAPGKLVQGDNLRLMGALLQDPEQRFDLIYIDPPYGTGDRFFRGQDPGGGGGARPAAYTDRWAGGLAGYLEMMAPRLQLMRELLTRRGSLFVHVDQRASSHLRLLLDEIFGPDALVNEIAWCYGGGGAPRKRYPRKHDSILWYARGREWIFNRQYRPYTEGTRKRGLTRVKGDRYKLRPEGAGLDDWWTGPEVQKILSPTAAENLKYPTQKPEGLLRRIIAGHSEPGSLVGDFFCGAGTTLAVAGQLGRRWAGCDGGQLAIQTCRKRLAGLGPFQVMVEQGAEQGGRLHGWGVAMEGGVLSLHPPDGQAGPDFWAADWEHDGEVFRGAWWCRATRKVPAVLEVAAPGDAGSAAVLIVTADGEEGIVRVEG